jgi:hypothetical protein
MSKNITLPHPNQTPITDPITCGEDHRHNLALATAYALQFCGTCADYHATVSINRILGTSAWFGISRPALVDFISNFLDEGAGSRDILIAGAGDTSTFATCAHAVAVKGPRYIEATRFHILDKCETPLALCRDFARRHNLTARIGRDDLMKPSGNYLADIIILHSVLNFIPVEHHPDILRNALSWLKPNGRLFVWNALPLGPGARAKAALRTDNERVRQMLADGELTIGEDRETFLSRLEARRARYGVVSGLPASYFETILAELSVQVVSLDVHDDVRILSDGQEFRRQFLQAVLGRNPTPA